MVSTRKRVAWCCKDIYSQYPCSIDKQKVIDWPLPNVWLGTSVECQYDADKRIPHLLACPVGEGAGRFLSCEPLIGGVDLNRIHSVTKFIGGGTEQRWDSCLIGKAFVPEADGDIEVPNIHWVIACGESGPFDDVRMCRLSWFRSIKDQCEEAGVPFFMKQMGVMCHDFDDPRAPCKDTKIGTGKGGDMNEWPADLRVRQVPDGLKVGE